MVGESISAEHAEKNDVLNWEHVAFDFYAYGCSHVTMTHSAAPVA